MQEILSTQWLARQFPIINVTFDPSNDNVIIMHDDTTITVINKNTETSNEENHLENGNHIEENMHIPSDCKSQNLFKFIKKYKVKNFTNFIN